MDIYWENIKHTKYKTSLYKDILLISKTIILRDVYSDLKEIPDRRLQAQLLCIQKLLIYQPTVHPYGYLQYSEFVHHIYQIKKVKNYKGHHSASRRVKIITHSDL